MHRGWCRVRRETQDQEIPWKPSLHCVSIRLGRDPCLACWAVRHSGLPVWRVGAALPCAPGPKHVGCARTACAQTACARFASALVMHTRVSMCVARAAIRQAALQKPGPMAAAHQNSIEQFRSRSKDCVIITTYW